MNTKSWVEPLLKLQKIDIEIAKISDELYKNPLRKELLTENLLDAQKSYDEILQKKRQIEIDIKELQHQIEQKEQQILSLKTKMNSIKDNATYRLAMQEIKQVEMIISQIETRELELMDVIDEKQIIINEAKVIVDKQLVIVNEQSQKFDEQFTTLTQQKEDKEKLYLVIRDAVDKEIFNLYLRIRQSLGGRKGAILVEITEDRCGSCFIKLTAQKLIDAKKRTPKATCNNCGVLIYQ